MSRRHWRWPTRSSRVATNAMRSASLARRAVSRPGPCPRPDSPSTCCRAAACGEAWGPQRCSRTPVHSWRPASRSSARARDRPPGATRGGRRCWRVRVVADGARGASTPGARRRARTECGRRSGESDRRQARSHARGLTRRDRAPRGRRDRQSRARARGDGRTHAGLAPRHRGCGRKPRRATPQRGGARARRALARARPMSSSTM